MPEAGANMIAGDKAAKVWQIEDVAARVAAKREAHDESVSAGGG